MNDFIRALVGVFAAIAPLGAIPPFSRMMSDLEPRTRNVLTVALCLGALALLAAVAAAGNPFLDWLDVSPENFQLAAALLMLPQAFHLLARGESLGGTGLKWDGRVTSLLVVVSPLLAGPAALGAAVSYGTRFGIGTAIGAAFVALVFTVLILALAMARAWDGRVIRALAVLSGALLVVIAVEMAVDGVQSV
jgi:small neutral amino acid transporter SnatA (MarC family)